MSKKALGIIVVLVIAIIGAGAAYAILSKDKAPAPQSSAPVASEPSVELNPLTGLEMPDDQPREQCMLSHVVSPSELRDYCLLICLTIAS